MIIAGLMNIDTSLCSGQSIDVLRSRLCIGIAGHEGVAVINGRVPSRLNIPSYLPHRVEAESIE
jgi:hypothetical protein